jgi:tRNA nucleotidyltransferase (CCA-adding enzyme)
MEVILTHENTDFDGLASQLAARKLHPEAHPVVPHRPNRNLRDFLTIYWDELPFVHPEDLPKGHISRIILVDTQIVPMQLKGIDDDTRIRIIDHHPLDIEPDERTDFKGEAIGATTTLLIERLREGHIHLSPVEATLLLLGIYEDTGGLSYITTTPRDVYAAAWLLDIGASLKVANEYLNRPLTPEQQRVYHELTQRSRVLPYRGQSILISLAEAGSYVEELSTLAHKLTDLYDPDASFIIVQLDGDCQVIARSTTDAVDVAQIIRPLGGGGHAKAAAALVEEIRLDDLHQQLMELIHQHVKPAISVRQIMSFGVHTLAPQTTISQADQMMRRYGHEGFPVVADGQLVGILTRREIDKALQHRLGNAPIEVYMHKGPVSVTPDDPVEQVQKAMMDHGLGQVPVVDGGQIIGIVTRTDLIKLWSESGETREAPDLTEQMRQSLPPSLFQLLIQAGETAHSMGYSLYVVGGFVRDLLLGIPNLDLDLVVEGDAIALAKRLAGDRGGRTRSHSRFGTAKWLLPQIGSGAEQGRQAGGSLALDFVTARTEFYEHPTALPQVERSSIKQDLYRRDFTINTMAISVEKDHFGSLLDFYGGKQDLEMGLIRVLHNLSFVEDPTRMLRAVRFEQRLEFQIEERTRELIDDALELLDRVTGERIRQELELILNEGEPERALCRLDQLGILGQIHPHVRCDAWAESAFRRLRDQSSTWHDLSPSEPRLPLTGISLMPLLTYRMRPGEVESLISRLKIGQQDAELMRQMGELRALIPILERSDLRPSETYRLLEHHSSTALMLFWIVVESNVVKDSIARYQRELRWVKPAVDGSALETMGIPQGPIYGDILQALRNARLDGEVTTLEEERDLIKQLLSRRGPGQDSSNHSLSPD